MNRPAGKRAAARRITGKGALVAGLAHASGAGVSKNPDEFSLIRRGSVVARLAYIEQWIAKIRQNPRDRNTPDLDNMLDEMLERVEDVRRIYKTGREEEWERARYVVETLEARAREVEARTIAPLIEAGRNVTGAAAKRAEALAPRNIKMAREFLARRGRGKKDSALIKEIRARHNLKKSAAHAAVKDGLKRIRDLENKSSGQG